MKFVFTPEEAQPVARQVYAHLKKAGYQVSVEKSHSEDAPYRTTLLAKQGQLVKLIEADLRCGKEGSSLGESPQPRASSDA
jgi:hypothetical protein